MSGDEIEIPPQRIAITGGRGRLAPAIQRDLGAAACEVHSFSRSAGGNFRELKELLDPKVLGEFDDILHLGWSSVPLVSEEDPGIEEREDFPFLRGLLEAQAAMERPPRLLFFSSAAVYGNTDSGPADETTRCLPLGRYAFAKLEAERMIEAADERIPRCILRVSNIFGTALRSVKPQGIIPYLYQAALSGIPARIWGDGSCTKDYIFINDFLSAVRAALAANLCGTFNIASGQSLSVRQIIDLVEEATNNRVALEYGEHYPWDVVCSFLSSRRFSVATGWKPRHDVALAIESFVHID